MASSIRPPERYGDDQPTWHRTLARVLASTLAVLGVAWVVWVGLSRGSAPVTATVVTYHVVDPATVEVALDVTSDDGRAARCGLEARSRRHLAVGSAELEIPASEERTRRVNAEVRTQEEAASVVLTGCEPV